MVRPAIHAGEILADELEELGISASELARSLFDFCGVAITILGVEMAITLH